ncbi:MAG: STAS domain-containing protein [Butyrivibrio sp.]|nr:STAS domain-containing protein [Butyrivibrio sp.]
MLNIEKKENGNEVTLVLDGRLDTTTAPSLEEEVKAVVGGAKKLVFDLKELQYISSAGLRVLLSAQKTMNKQGSMLVKNVSDDVNEIFEVTGFSDILTIE